MLSFFVTTCLGAIVINLSRNIIVTSVVGVIYGFVSCLFIGSERGFVIPGSFAYRVSMFFSDKSTYYEVPISATIGGCISIVFCFIVLFLVGLIVFSHKKKSRKLTAGRRQNEKKAVVKQTHSRAYETAALRNQSRRFFSLPP